MIDPELQIQEIKFLMKAANQPRALKALNKDGGRGYREIRYLSRVLELYQYRVIFSSYDENEPADIIGLYRSRASAYHLEFFKTIAPYVEAGSYIWLYGADGHHVRWFFDGKECVEQQGKVVFE